MYSVCMQCEIVCHQCNKLCSVYMRVSKHNARRLTSSYDIFRTVLNCREVWPDGGQFGAADISPEQEFMSLREIFLADIPSKSITFVIVFFRICGVSSVLFKPTSMLWDEPKLTDRQLPYNHMLKCWSKLDHRQQLF